MQFDIPKLPGYTPSRATGRGRVKTLQREATELQWGRHTETTAAAAAPRGQQQAQTARGRLEPHGRHSTSQLYPPPAPVRPCCSPGPAARRDDEQRWWLVTYPFIHLIFFSFQYPVSQNRHVERCDVVLVTFEKLLGPMTFARWSRSRTRVPPSSVLLLRRPPTALQLSQALPPPPRAGQWVSPIFLLRAAQ